MARRRRFRGLVSIPAVGFHLPTAREVNPLGHSVNSTDVLVGAGIGLAGGMGVRYLLKQTGLLGSLPAIVNQYLVPISTILAGLLAVAFEKNQSKANGHYVGAVAAGLTPILGGLLVQYLPQFAGLVSVPSVGMLVDDSFGGMLIDDPQMGRFAALSAYGAGEDESVIAAA